MKGLNLADLFVLFLGKTQIFWRNYYFVIIPLLLALISGIIWLIYEAKNAPLLEYCQQCRWLYDKQQLKKFRKNREVILVCDDCLKTLCSRAYREKKYA